LTKTMTDTHVYDKSLSDAIVRCYIDYDTVVDIGCGKGEYVRNFIDNGISCMGFDGSPLTPELTEGLCRVMDFSEHADIGKFDMVLSLEVGEHIPRNYEQIFFDNICGASEKKIVLSWAIEGQGGNGHYNERNNNYVIIEMGKRGFLWDVIETQYLRKNSTLPWFKNTIMAFHRDMYYKRIEGWFNYAGFYDEILSIYDKGIFVEIGVWKGKSIMYMAERIKGLKKDVKCYAIDTFKGNQGVEIMNQDRDIINGTLYETYLKNTEPLKDYITTIVGDSHEVFKQFVDSSIDFLFIDGDHSYKAVKEDIRLWLPKVKTGGIISGHDYDNPDVKKAVDEVFPVKEVWGTGCLIWHNIK
jgi:SAM-dependent methyltransferase